jgi:hypothetical protein
VSFADVSEKMLNILGYRRKSWFARIAGFN